MGFRDAAIGSWRNRRVLGSQKVAREQGKNSCCGRWRSCRGCAFSVCTNSSSLGIHGHHREYYILSYHGSWVVPALGSAPAPGWEGDHPQDVLDPTYSVRNAIHEVVPSQPATSVLACSFIRAVPGFGRYDREPLRRRAPLVVALIAAVAEYKRGSSKKRIAAYAALGYVAGAIVPCAFDYMLGRPVPGGWVHGVSRAEADRLAEERRRAYEESGVERTSQTTTVTREVL